MLHTDGITYLYTLSRVSLKYELTDAQGNRQALESGTEDDIIRLTKTEAYESGDTKIRTRIGHDKRSM